MLTSNLFYYLKNNTPNQVIKKICPNISFNKLSICRAIGIGKRLVFVYVFGLQKLDKAGLSPISVLKVILELTFKQLNRMIETTRKTRPQDFSFKLSNIEYLIRSAVE